MPDCHLQPPLLLLLPLLKRPLVLPSLPAPQNGGTQLDRPIRMTYKKCRAGSVPGPCRPQTNPAELSLGGVIYADPDFYLPAS